MRYSRAQRPLTDRQKEVVKTLFPRLPLEDVAVFEGPNRFICDEDSCTVFLRPEASVPQVVHEFCHVSNWYELPDEDFEEAATFLHEASAAAAEEYLARLYPEYREEVDERLCELPWPQGARTALSRALSAPRIGRDLQAFLAMIVDGRYL